MSFVIVHEGVKYRLLDRRTIGDKQIADLEEISLVREILEYAKTRIGWRWLLGCARCTMICVDIRLCKCCAVNKVRNPGGEIIQSFKDETVTHRGIMLLEDFLARAAARAA